MDKQVQEIRNEIAIFVNNIILNNKEEGQRGAYPPDTVFELGMTDDNVLVETDSECKEDIFVEESEEHVNDFEELSCEICEMKLKSLTNLKRHDQRFHLK